VVAFASRTTIAGSRPHLALEKDAPVSCPVQRTGDSPFWMDFITNTSGFRFSAYTTELTGMAVLRFSQERQIERRYTAPGKPTQTLSSRLSTPACATNSMRRCSPHSGRLAPR
jgi:hypothetical protein